MLVTLEVRSSIKCDECSVKNPLPGLRGSVSCRNCNEHIDIIKTRDDCAQGGVHYEFGGYCDALALAVLRKDGEVVWDGLNDDTMPVFIVRNDAACTCKTALPIPNEGDTSVTCPSCKDRIAVRWPDELTKKYDDRLWCIIGDANDREDDSSLEPKGTDAKVVGCSACGAPLTLDGNRRVATCTYCQATNILSDAQRLQLFPKSTDHPYFMLYRVNDALLGSLLRKEVEGNVSYDGLQSTHKAAWDRLMRELEARAKEKRDAKLAESGALEDDDAHAMAAREDLTEAQARALDGRLTQKQRLDLRSYKIALKLLKVWATSTSAETRAYAAAHLDLKDEHLKDLLRDPEASVRLTVAERDDIYPEYVTELAADADARVRAAIAENALTSPETLRHLSKDPDADVAKAAKQNPKYVPGFFEKLFS